MGIGPIKAQLLILKESKLREGPISKHTNGKDGIKVHAGEIDLNGDGECGGEETFRWLFYISENCLLLRFLLLLD